MNLPLCRSQWPPSLALAAVRHGEQFIIVVGRRFLTEHTAGVRCGTYPFFTISVNAFTIFLRATAPCGKTVIKSTGPGSGPSRWSKHFSKHRLSADDDTSGHLKGLRRVSFRNMITSKTPKRGGCERRPRRLKDLEKDCGAMQKCSSSLAHSSG